MTLNKRTSILLTLLIFAASYAAEAKKQPKHEQYGVAYPLTSEQSSLVERSIAREKLIIKDVQQRSPLVETYIQDVEPNVHLYQVPVGDTYFLGRVDFAKLFVDKAYQPRPAEQRAEKKPGGILHSSLSAFGSFAKLFAPDRFSYSQNGFMQMIFLDPQGFDQQHYVFSFVRREFLGSVRTAVFDVHPIVPGDGRFYGRIWIEDRDSNIVRFNGTYTGVESPESAKHFFHFDSWRQNVQPNVWLPVSVYVEETQRLEGSKTIGLKALTHIWGYALKRTDSDASHADIIFNNVVDNSKKDISPLQASRMWVTQAENNMIDRLVEAGLVAPVDANGFEANVLEPILYNLAAANKLAFTDQIHARILLTNTIEATTVGNTVLISKGLIDTLPNAESLSSVLAMELAHIALGHHIDTRYAFNDRLLFPDENSFERLDMYHSEHDNLEAAKKAYEYLQASDVKDKLTTAGLFYAQLAERAKQLKQLNSPKLGDSLLKPDGTPWMSELWQLSPRLDWDDMNQVAALPLSSQLKTNPWDDKVSTVNADTPRPMNARDKLPFEVTPTFYRLQYFEDAQKAAATAPAAAPAADAAPAAPAAPATPAVDAAPAATAPAAAAPAAQ